MEAVREKWTDDMSGRMGEMATRGKAAEVKSEIVEEMHRHFDAMHRLIIRGGAMLFVTLVIGFLSLALTQN